MKTSHIIAAAALALVAAAGAQAETYEGVTQAVSTAATKSTPKPCAPPPLRTRT